MQEGRLLEQGCFLLRVGQVKAVYRISQGVDDLARARVEDQFGIWVVRKFQYFFGSFAPVVD